MPRIQTVHFFEAAKATIMFVPVASNQGSIQRRASSELIAHYSKCIPSVSIAVKYWTAHLDLAVVELVFERLPND